MANVRSEKVELTVSGETQTMPAFLALPEGAGPFPAVIVFEEIFGINSHIRDVTQRIAAEGYVAIAPDYHFRNWPRGTEYAYDQAGMAKGMEMIPKLRSAQLKADIDATIAFLRTRKEVNSERLGAIGFCIGGHAAYFAAAVAPITATASFYAGGVAVFGLGDAQPTVSRSADIKGKLLCFFGGKDGAIPPEQVATVRKALADGKVDHEVVIYDDATHGFFCDQRGSYNPPAAADAWERVKRFFAQALR